MIQYKTYSLGDALTLDLDVETVDPIKVYDMVGVYSYGRGLFSKGKVNGSETSYKKFYRLHHKSVVFSQLFGWEGAISLVDSESIGKYVSSQFPTFSANQSIVDINYLSWWLRQKKFWDYLKRQAKGLGDRRRTLNPEIILSAQIDLPDLNIQHEISRRIEKLMHELDCIKRLSEENTDTRLSLLISMSHRNDLSEQEKADQGWEKIEIGDVITQTSRPVNVEMGESYAHFGIYSFAKGLFAKSALNGSEIKAKKLYRVESGQFIYGRLNAYEGAFGLVTDDLDGAHVSNEFPAFRCDEQKIIPEFLMAYFSTPVVWENLKRKVTGIGGGAGNRRIRLKESVLLAEEIWLPPLAWQQKIRQVSEKLAVVKKEREKNVKEIEELLPAILDKAFKGEL